MTQSSFAQREPRERTGGRCDWIADVGVRCAGFAGVGCSGGVRDLPGDVPDLPGARAECGAVARGGAEPASGSRLAGAPGAWARVKPIGGWSVAAAVVVVTAV